MKREVDNIGVYVIMEDQEDFDAVNNGDLTEVDIAYTGSANWNCTECEEEFGIKEKIYVTIPPRNVGNERLTGSYCRDCIERKAVKHAL